MTPKQPLPWWPVFKRAQDERCQSVADSMGVELSDGRILGVPMAWFPRRRRGSAEPREQVSISSRGLHRKALDEDISINGPLAGRGDQTRPRRAAGAA